MVIACAYRKIGHTLYLRQYLISEDRVLFDQIIFFVGKLGGFIDYRIGYAYLADIVQEPHIIDIELLLL